MITILKLSARLEDWFFTMQGSAETNRFFQEQLRFRKFYDGPADGKPNAAYVDALAAYRKAAGVKVEGEPDLEVFTAFLLRHVPKAPEKLFAVSKSVEAKDGASRGIPDAAAKKELKLAVTLAKTRYKKDEPIELTLTGAQPAYVYCYVQSPSTGKIQRIFPNRFARDPRVEANTPVVLPGAQGFKVLAGTEGVRQQVVGCLATEREVYNELPPQLRWGDFEEIKLDTFEEIRAAFAQVGKAPVALEGALIEVSEKRQGEA